MFILSSRTDSPGRKATRRNVLAAGTPRLLCLAFVLMPLSKTSAAVTLLPEKRSSGSRKLYSSFLIAGNLTNGKRLRTILKRREKRRRRKRRDELYLDISMFDERRRRNIYT